MWKLLKWVFISVCALLLIAAAVAVWWFPRHGEAWLDAALRQRIAETIDRASVEGYTFRMQGLQTDVRSGSVVVTGMALNFDLELLDSLRTGTFQYLFDAKADRIELRGLSLWRLLWKNEFKATSFTLSGPMFNYLISGRKVDLKDPFLRMKGKKASARVTLLSADTIKVLKASATVQDLGGRLPDMQVSGLDVEVNGVQIFMGKKQRSGVRLSVTSAELRLDSISAQLADSAAFSVGSVELSLSKRNGVIRKVQHVAARPDSLHAFRRTVTDLSVDSLVLNAMDVDRLIANQILNIGHAELFGLNMKAELDKTLPEEDRNPKPLPPAALLDLGFSVCVDSVSVYEATFAYREKDDKTRRWGEVPFSHLSGSFKHISNDAKYIEKFEKLTGSLSGTFFDTASISMNYEAELNGSQKFMITGTTENLPAVKLNAVSKPMGRIQVENGTLNTLYLRMEGNEKKARGILRIHYTDLIARVEPGTSREQYNRMLGTVLETMQKEDYGGGLSADRERSFTVERDPTRALTAYLWHATREGLTRNLMPEAMERVKLMLRTDSEQRKEERARRKALKENR